LHIFVVITFWVDFESPPVRKICFESLPVRKLKRLRTTGLCWIPSKHGPQQQVLRGPIKMCWTVQNWTYAHHWVQCYSLNNRISHWCNVSSFHWTTLMQDTLNITGAGDESDFMW